MEIFGILSAILYNLSGLLLVLKVVKQGRAKEVMATIYLLPWFGGSVTGFLYALSLHNFLLSINFGCGVIFGLIIIMYRIRE